MIAVVRTLAALFLAGACVATTASRAASAPAAAGAGVRMAPVADPFEESENWAGYAVTAAAGASTTFRAVSGTWVQPRATCSEAGATYSGFWVGLGGFVGSKALEQIGTSSDCTDSGAATYSAWYELIPAPPVPIKLKVAAGDTISALVAVSGSNVTLRIRNVTRHGVFTKKLTSSALDLTSAEWVAEAPSSCDGFGRCRTLPLTNFGTITFSGAAAATSDGAGGTISNPAWATTALRLVSRSPVEIDPSTGAVRIGSDDEAPGAVPSALSADGTGFSVTFRPDVG